MAEDVYVCYERLPAAERKAAKKGFETADRELRGLGPVLNDYVELHIFPRDASSFARWIIYRHNGQNARGMIQDSFDLLCPGGGFNYTMPPQEYEVWATALDVYACYERLPAAERKAVKTGFDTVLNLWWGLTASDPGWVVDKLPDFAIWFAGWIIGWHNSPERGMIQDVFDALCPGGGFNYTLPPQG